MRLIHAPSTDLTYDDCFFLPGRSAITSRFDVDLSSDDGTGTTIPLIAANMTAVTGRRMAEVMARRGGLAVLPQDLSPERIDSIVRSVKSRDLLVDHPLTLTPQGTLGQAADLLPKRPHGIVVVIDEQDRPLGTISAEEIAGRDTFSEVGDVLSEDVPVLGPADLEASPAELHGRIAATHHDAAVVVDEDGVLRGVLTATGVLRSTIYRPATDAEGRLRIAVAVGVNADVAARVRDLVAVGVDVIVLDTAHGHQDKMIDALRIAREALGPREGTAVRLAAGNIVTAEGTRELIEAGADIVKVGVGPGAMCTTRMMTGVGRPQFSAVLECAAEARRLGGHVGRRRRAPSARRRARARRGRLERDDRLLVRGHLRVARPDAHRRERPPLQGVLRHGLQARRLPPHRARGRLRACPQGPVRGGHLHLADVPHRGQGRGRGPAGRDHRRGALLVHLRRRGQHGELPRAGRDRSAGSGRLRRGAPDLELLELSSPPPPPRVPQSVARGVGVRIVPGRIAP